MVGLAPGRVLVAIFHELPTLALGLRCMRPIDACIDFNLHDLLVWVLRHLHEADEGAVVFRRDFKMLD